jgi:BASS family bile acid:Na+ symporter
MSFADIIILALQASIFFTVFGFGLTCSFEDIKFPYRHPSLFARSLLSMYIIVPVCAVAIAALFPVHPAVKIAIVALALSPLLPQRVLKAGGASSYAFGILFNAALLSVVLIPIGVTVVASISNFAPQAAVSAIVNVVLLTVIAPFAIGVAIHHYAPNMTARIAKPISMAALSVLVVCSLFVLYMLLPAMISLIGNGTVLVFVVFVAVGIIAGHLLGGPEEGNRIVLAHSSAVRHPAVALAIASANFPDEKLVIPAVFLYLLVNVLVFIPYLAWRRHSQHKKDQAHHRPIQMR